MERRLEELARKPYLNYKAGNIRRENLRLKPRKRRKKREMMMLSSSMREEITFWPMLISKIQSSFTSKQKPRMEKVSK